MKLFGLDISISRAKTSVPATSIPAGWDFGFGYPFWGSGTFNHGSWPIIAEPFTGAWQKNVIQRPDSILAYYAVYSCVSLIASDISKLRLRLMSEGTDNVWEETDTPAFTPVLTKPNHYQNRIKFLETWVVSKLTRGNAYILKERDARNVVVALYPLDAARVKPLVAPDGSVYYDLGGDVLSGIPDGIAACPASEIIHDVMVPLYHPLCGVSPIVACALPAIQGMNIQSNSTKFFLNGSNPGGILTAPTRISDDTAKRIKDYWEQNYTGQNVGKIAVLGDGLKYEPMAVKAVDAQLIEQLKWTAEQVASCFHVPPFMVGLGPTPAYNNISALKDQYYSQCLQALMQCIEVGMDEGLALPDKYEIRFDLDDLLRMDSFTQVEAAKASVGAGIMSPNEARQKFDLKPVTGGEQPFLQEQYYSLEALSKRDQAPPSPPIGPANAPSPAPATAPPPAPTKAITNEQRGYLVDRVRRRARLIAA